MFDANQGYIMGTDMVRESDGKRAIGVPDGAVAGFEKLGFKAVTRPDLEPLAASDPVDARPVFDLSKMDLGELKAAYGRAMSEGVELPDPHGNARRGWYERTLADSGWTPKETAEDV